MPPEIPIVFIDTGYLFAETYRYAAQLEEAVERLTGMINALHALDELD